MLTDYVLPALFALFIWWFGTGLVLLLDSLPRTTFRWSLAVSTGIAIAALVCLERTAGHATVGGAYAAFTCAVLAWGWHELAFLTGWITGPRKAACSQPGHGPTRFNEAVQVILWHELAIIAMAMLISWLTWGQPNQVASWTFWLLWVMRLSAKLNLYLGVRNLSLDFLPERLGYLGSYFRRRRFNALMPWSLLLGGLAMLWVLGDVALAQPGARAARLLLASTLALALVEHLLMVLPLQPSLLWRWALKREAVAAR